MVPFYFFTDSFSVCRHYVFVKHWLSIRQFTEFVIDALLYRGF